MPFLKGRGGTVRARWRCPRVLAAVALASFCGCASTTDRADREQLDAFTGDAGAIERSTAENAGAPTEVVLDALRLPGANRDNLRAARRRAEADFAAGGATGLGVRSSFPPACPAAPCASGFCAGVAARSLDPESLLPALPDLPSSFLLRLLTGDSRPPLAGYGTRLRTNLIGQAIRLAFRDQYYAHLFKDSTGSPSTGPRNQVKAVVMSDDDGGKLYWVRTDLIGGFQDLRAKVLEELRDRGLCDVHDGNLLLTGTHTHSGLGALNPRWFFALASVDLFQQDLFERVAARIAETVLAADADLGPAKLGTGAATLATITHNRRETCPGDPPNSPPDPTLGVIRIDRPGLPDTPLATLFNFSIHPTSLGAANLELRPDNVGWAEREVERQAGGMAMFFNGTEGDVAPDAGGAQAIGEVLGQAVVAARGDIAATQQVALYTRYCQLDDPDVPPAYPAPCPEKLERIQFRPLMFSAASTAGCFVDRGDHPLVIEISKTDDPPLLEREGVVMGAHRIDTGIGAAAKRTVILTLPGEPITDIGHEIRAAASAGNDHVWVFGLANAHMGYIVTEQEYLQGGYESGSNLFGPTAGTVFRDNAVHLESQLPP